MALLLNTWPAFDIFLQDAKADVQNNDYEVAHGLEIRCSTPIDPRFHLCC